MSEGPWVSYDDYIKTKEGHWYVGGVKHDKDRQDIRALALLRNNAAFLIDMLLKAEDLLIDIHQVCQAYEDSGRQCTACRRIDWLEEMEKGVQEYREVGK
jgi:hypothetical protein